MKAVLVLALLAGTARADGPPPPPPPFDPPRLDGIDGPPDPASMTVPPPGPPTRRVFDSRDAFDSRRAAFPLAVMLETQLSEVFGERPAALSLTVAFPLASFGRVRVSAGSYVPPTPEPAAESQGYDPSLFRFALGWEHWVGCVRRSVCLGGAADASYAFVDPLDGTLLTPHVFVDLKTKRARGLGARLGGGPTVLLATSTAGGRDRVDVGFSLYLNFAIWNAY